MRREPAPGLRREGRVCLVALVALLPLLLPLVNHGSGASAGATGGAPAAAPALQMTPAPWTAVGATGVVDEQDAPYAAFGFTELTFRTANSGYGVVARYNVTNTSDNNANPGWTTLELGSTAPAKTLVEARLYRVNPCNGQVIIVCAVENDGGGGPRCDTCQFGGVAVDFSRYLYFVYVKMNRTNSMNSMPQVFTLRIK